MRLHVARAGGRVRSPTAGRAPNDESNLENNRFELLQRDRLLQGTLILQRTTRSTSDTIRRVVGRSGLLSHRVSLGVTMSQKSSLPQDAKSVSLALTPNTADWPSAVTGASAMPAIRQVRDVLLI